MLTVKDQGRILSVEWSGEASLKEAQDFVKAYEHKLRKAQRFCLLINCLDISTPLKPMDREYLSTELKRLTPLDRLYSVGSVVLVKSIAVRAVIKIVAYFRTSDDSPLKDFSNHEDAFRWINDRFRELNL